MAGITVDVWTLTKFLSKHAVRDTYGVIETPETSGLIPTTASAIDAGPTPVPEFSPLPTPGASPTPTLRPISSPATSFGLPGLPASR
jgi:hypothetical protein